MQPLSSADGDSADGDSEALRHEVEYDPTLSGAELLEVVRALLASRRHAEQLICRYLADLADRIDEHGDEWLGARIYSVGAPMPREGVEDIARRHLGLSRRNTRERIRVGRALRTLPKIERAFLDGELSYSRVREVTRIATATTEVVWLELARTLDMRTLERRVAQAGLPVTKDVRRPQLDGSDVELDPFDPFELIDACGPWIGRHAENDRRQVSDGAVREATSESRRNGTPRHDEVEPNKAKKYGYSDQTGAASEHSEEERSRVECARAEARVEWTSAARVRVTLELSAAAWILLEPAIGVALREDADVWNAGESLDAWPPFKARSRQVEVNEGRPAAGPERAPVGMSEQAAGGATHLGNWEPSGAIEPDGVGEERAPVGMSEQAAGGATHLGNWESLGAIEPDGVGEERASVGMSEQAAGGATHLGSLERSGANDRDGVDEVWAPIGMSEQAVGAVGATQLGSFAGNQRERSPIGEKLPGIAYAPAAGAGGDGWTP